MKKITAIFFASALATLACAQPSGGAALPQAAAMPMPQALGAPQAIMPQAMPSPQAEQKKKPDPEKFAALFPKIEADAGKIGIPFWREHWVAIALCALAALALAALVFRKRKAAPISPKDRALLRISRAVAKSDRLGAGAYALEISHAARDYIEDKYSLPAPERTTQEFLKMAAQSEIFDDSSREILARILNLSDMAKFARHSFLEGERTELSEAAISFIETDDARSRGEKPADEKRAGEGKEAAK